MYCALTSRAFASPIIDGGLHTSIGAADSSDVADACPNLVSRNENDFRGFPISAEGRPATRPWRPACRLAYTRD
jgi:hypothetical protein